MSGKQAELETLLDCQNKNEVACGAFLGFCLELLLGRIPVRIASIVKEHRNFFGSSDFAVSATYKSEVGRMETAAFIWEVKAPQCYIMRQDDNGNRFRPTLDLYKAENQLLHYVYEAKHNGVFRDKFKIGATDEIYPGGIIIGTDSRLVESDDEEEHNKASTSLKIRQHFLYHKQGIRILTWNRIVEFLAKGEVDSSP